MLLRSTLILFMTLTPGLFAQQGKQAHDRLLPDELTETETQAIIREQKPRSHVEATLKISDARVDSSAKNLQESQYKDAAQDIDVYAALIRYADDYTRKLPGSQNKDRNHCLKKIEQTIFKQTRILDAVLRDLPYDYRESSERAVNDVKKIRLRAINDLLGGGNVINSSN